MENILKTIKSCAGEVTLTKAQADEISSYIEDLKEGAALGESYKKELSGEVAGMLCLALPNVDGELLRGVTEVMTVKELLGFKKGLKETANKAEMKPQLTKSGEHTNNRDYSQFRI